MNRTTISNHNELQHWGIKGMKWDKEKETPKRSRQLSSTPSGENQNSAVLKLKNSFKEEMNKTFKLSAFKEEMNKTFKPESLKQAKLIVIKKSNLTWRDLLRGTGDGKVNKVELKGFEKVGSKDLNK